MKLTAIDDDGTEYPVHEIKTFGEGTMGRNVIKAVRVYNHKLNKREWLDTRIITLRADY